jgi:cell division protein FtsX
MSEHDTLDRALERMTDEATAGVRVPGPGDIQRRGRRHRRNQVLTGALAALLVVAAAVPAVRSGLLAGTSVPPGGPAPQPSPLPVLLPSDKIPVPAGDVAGPGATGYLGYWTGRMDVTVFLANDVTPERTGELHRLLERRPEVARVFYESKEQAFARFQDQFRDVPEMRKGLTAPMFPSSLRVRLRDPDQPGQLVAALCPKGTPDGPEPGTTRGCADGVDIVVDQYALTKPAIVGDYWPSRADVTVALDPRLDDAGREALMAEAREQPGVAAVAYETPEQAEARSTIEAPEGQQLPGSRPGSPLLPGSLRVTLTEPARATAFRDSFCRTPETGACADGVIEVYLHPRTGG